MNIIDKSLICAVITTFKPGGSLSDNLLKVSQQVGGIILVDDTGTPYHSDTSLDIVPKLTYVVNETNSGIAFSLNVGIKRAIKEGFKWVLTLDDDTTLDDDYLNQIIMFLNKSEVENIGLISCSREINTTNDFQIKRNMITSGCFFDVRVFLDSGKFKDDLFIDLVDFDFCVRVRNKGYKIIQISYVGMQHKVGNSKVKNLLGLPIVIYHHLPFRLYYQVRNPFLFFKLNYKADFLLSAYLLLNPVKIILKTIFFEEQKLVRLKYIFKGLKDGIINKGGKLNGR